MYTMRSGGIVVKFQSSSLALESVVGTYGMCDWLDRLMWPVRSYFVVAFMANFLSCHCIRGGGNNSLWWV